MTLDHKRQSALLEAFLAQVKFQQLLGASRRASRLVSKKVLPFRVRHGVHSRQHYFLPHQIYCKSASAS